MSRLQRLLILATLACCCGLGVHAVQRAWAQESEEKQEESGAAEAEKKSGDSDSADEDKETESESTVVEVGPQPPSNYDKKKAEAQAKQDEEESEERHSRRSRKSAPAKAAADKSESGANAAEAPPRRSRPPDGESQEGPAGVKADVQGTQEKDKAAAGQFVGPVLPSVIDDEEGPPGPSPEHSEDLLPGFAQEQPGFIPDVSPQDLMTQPGPAAQVDPFSTPLGPSRLPTQSASQIITRADMNPEIDLPDNFARIVVPTGTITGSTKTKQFHIEGGLKIYYNKVIITGQTADIDEKNEVAVIRGSVAIVDPQYTLNTDELRIYFNDKRFEALGFVQFKKEAKPGQSEPNLALEKKERVREYFAGQRFELYCKKLFYNWNSKEMSALDSVRLVHPSFNGTMERMDYNDKDKVYEMSGTVILEVTDYEWIFSNQLADAKDEKKIRAITANPTKITCDRMQYSEETGIAEFYALSGAQVKFDQSVRVVTAAYMEVNDKTKDFYAEGVPEQKAHYEQTDGQWLFDAEVLSRQDSSADLQKALEGKLTAEARTITFNYDRKRLEMQDGVSVAGETQTINADEMIQDETAKFFLLHGNVLVKPDADNELRAAQIYVDTENDVFTFVGLVQGKLKDEQIPSLIPETAETPGAAGGSGNLAPAEGLFQQQGPLPGEQPGRSVSKAKPRGQKSRREDGPPPGAQDSANVAEKSRNG